MVAKASAGTFFFLSKSPGGHAIYRQNARAVWNAKYHPEVAYKHKLWTAPRQESREYQWHPAFIKH